MKLLDPFVEPDQPIIRSLLEADFYKETMGQVIVRRHPDVRVKFAFKNRHRHIRLADCLDLGELREQLDHCRSLGFTRQELHYLLGTYEYEQPMFGIDYIRFLQNFRLPEYHLDTHDGQLVLEFEDEWAYSSRWETLAMSVVAELYGRHQMKGLSVFERQRVWAEGQRRLGEKIKVFKSNPLITYSDFGNRRRFAGLWHDYVVSVLAEEFPKPSVFKDNAQFRGTSNTWLAMKHGLTPTGTNAHELPMVYSAIYRDNDIALGHLVSQLRVLEDWEDQYGLALSIFLPDTYGSEYFYRLVPSEKIERWKGSRHDSGDPIKYGEDRIAMYKGLGVDPTSKLIVFADGQDPWQADRLERHFRDRIGVTFGPGTNITNDLGLGPDDSFKPLSIVIKAVEVNGLPVAKLSDNIEKATGDPAEIERMKKLTNYGNTYAEACRY